VALRVQAAGCRVIGQQQERNRMNRRAFPRGIRRGGGVALLAAGAGLALPGTAAAAPVAPNGFTVSTFATAPAGTPVTKGPDDITLLDGNVFVTWQNGVSKTGMPPGNSTVIEYSPQGTVLNSFSVAGRADGIGADPANKRVIVTVNEDGNSSLYTIAPGAAPSSQVVHYSYSPQPDATGGTGPLATGGGTDAVQVVDDKIYLSASNPSDITKTAVFEVTLDPATSTASLSPTFFDNSTATDALTGSQITLGLTDPDSNALVPGSAPRFPGQFVLDSQADQQLVFVRDIGAAAGFGPSNLTRLPLSHAGVTGGVVPAGVDDVRWTERPGGTLYVVDNGANTVYAVTGPFTRGAAYASLDTVGAPDSMGNAPANTTEVDSLDTQTGALTPFLSGLKTSKGLLYVSPPPVGEADDGDDQDGQGDENAQGKQGDQASARTAPGPGGQHVAPSHRGKHDKRHNKAHGAARHHHKKRSHPVVV
jgi:hypothetical protein